MLAVALGGRAAERLVFDDLSAGVADDLKRATRLARVMVTQCGMSERVGPVFFRDSEEHPFLGREMSETRDHSEHTAQLIDEEVGRILREADDRAYRLLEEHRDELERLTEALIEREVLSVAEIEEMIGKRATDDSEPEESTLRRNEIVASIDNPRRDRLANRLSVSSEPSPGRRTAGCSLDRTGTSAVSTSPSMTSTTAPVVCAGLVVADHVCPPLDHLPRAGELVAVDELVLNIGGGAANTAVDLARLGVTAAICARVGDDIFGRFATETLRAHKVDTRALEDRSARSPPARR